MTQTSSKPTAYHILSARGGGKVERCHCIPHQGSYNNAAHSWGVGMLMLQIFPEDFPRLAAACLTHDIPENVTGDIIATMMRFCNGLRDEVTLYEDHYMDMLQLPRFNDLSPEDHAKLKACDWIEFWLWCNDQFSMGNKFALEGMEEIERYINQKRMPEPAEEVFHSLKSIIEMRGSSVARQSGIVGEIAEKIIRERSKK